MVYTCAQKLDIAKKWYHILGFSNAFDAEFDVILNATDVSDLSNFSAYDYKNNIPQKNLIACLYFCEKLQEDYQNREISQEILIDSLQDLVLWNQSYYDIHGKMGLTEFPWIDRTFYMQIFRLGRLQFCMFDSEFTIEELGIKQGEPVLEVHIPRGGPLTKEACEDSFAQAKAFFDTYYPNFPHQFCTCHSWLLDDTLLPLLGEHSNVANFQKFFKIVQKDVSDDVLKFTFLWNTTRENVQSCEPNSSFSKKLKERAILKDTFYVGLGFKYLDKETEHE